MKEHKNGYTPVRICRKASSTPVASRADVSIKAKLFFSANDIASSVETALCNAALIKLVQFDSLSRRGLKYFTSYVSGRFYYQPTLSPR